MKSSKFAYGTTLPNSHSFQKQGQLKEKLENYQSALEDYDNAILLDSKNHFLYVLKAGAYEKLGNFGLALECFGKALSLNPNSSDAYINRALFYRRQKQYELAQQDYAKMQALAPRWFHITGFTTEDIFKYGRFKALVNFRGKEALGIGMNLSPNNEANVDTHIYVEAKKLPFLILKGKRFVKFGFKLARCLFYLHAYILKQKIKFVNRSVLNLY